MNYLASSATLLSLLLVANCAQSPDHTKTLARNELSTNRAFNVSAGHVRGEFLSITANKANFYAQIPGAEMLSPAKILDRGTPVKFISAHGMFYKIELLDSTIGYIQGTAAEPPHGATAESVPVVDLQQLAV